MTKVATVQSQQMWEYVVVNRKTEDGLIGELNEFGKAGWELVSASFNKDIKGVAASFSWTALLKRPLVPAVGPAPGVAAVQTAHVPAPHESHAAAQDAAEIFDVRAE